MAYFSNWKKTNYRCTEKDKCSIFTSLIVLESEENSQLVPINNNNKSDNII